MGEAHRTDSERCPEGTPSRRLGVSLDTFTDGKTHENGPKRPVLVRFAVSQPGLGELVVGGWLRARLTKLFVCGGEADTPKCDSAE